MGLLASVPAADRTVHRTVIMSIQCVFCLAGGNELSALEKRFETSCPRLGVVQRSLIGCFPSRASMRALIVAIAARADVQVPSDAPVAPRVRAKSSPAMQSPSSCHCRWALMRLAPKQLRPRFHWVKKMPRLCNQSNRINGSNALPLVIAMIESLSKGRASARWRSCEGNMRNLHRSDRN